MSKKHMGSSIDDFLKEEGIFEVAQAQLIKEVAEWESGEVTKNNRGDGLERVPGGVER